MPSMTAARDADRLLRSLYIGERHTPMGSRIQMLDDALRGAQLTTADAIQIFERLEGQGYVRTIGTMHDAPHSVMLTDDGRQLGRELHRRSESRVERELHLQNRLVPWVYEHVSFDSWTNLQFFATAEDWWFCGTEITWDEVFAAVDYLEAEALLRVERKKGDLTAIRVSPTSLGIDFAHSRVDLRSFMNSQHSQPSTTTNYISSNIVQGDAPGSNLATGGNATQIMKQGVDADALASLIAHLREVAPTLQLSEDDAQDLTAEIDTLEQEGSDSQRSRRIWRSISRIMAPALAAAAADHGIAAVMEAGTALLG